MGGAAKATIDHDFIRSWVEERGGKPSHVKGRGGPGDPGILRIDFPGFSGEGTLEAISWDEWFKAFDENNLAFLFQETTSQGQESRFNKLVSRDSVDEKDVYEGDGEGEGEDERAEASGEEIEIEVEFDKDLAEGLEGGDEVPKSQQRQSGGQGAPQQKKRRAS